MTAYRKPSSGRVIPYYTPGENIANSILHGIGTLSAIVGLVLLNLKTRGLFGGQWRGWLDNTGVILFTATMIGMFLVSTLYHAIQHQKTKYVLRVLDHSMVYVFIAGTYTPFCLSALGGAWGWTLFGIEWALAALGIILYVLNWKALHRIEVAVYICMGWIILVGWVPLVRSLATPSLVLLFSGGILYSLGAIVYRKKHLTGTHAVWHAFVLAGAFCHYLSVWFFH